MRKQRTFTPEFKAQVVLEVLTGVKSAAGACREYQLNDSTLSRWRQEFLEHAAEVFRRDKGYEQYEARVAELERMIGQQAVELAAAKKVSHILNSARSGSGS
jgi:transposase